MTASVEHQMKTFSVLPALYEGNPPFTGGFPSQRPVTSRGAFMFSLICAWRWWFETPSRSLWRHCNVTISPLRHVHSFANGRFNWRDGIMYRFTFHFASSWHRVHWSISRWILLRRKYIFGKSLKSSLSLYVPSLRFFNIIKANIVSPF